MNLQPLEYFEAIYACGLKLLHRNYAGPLLQVVRHNDGTEVLVYPDVNGSVSLDSPIELLSGNSQSGYLGEFLCVGSYTADAALGSPTPSVTAGVVTMFDQSVNINNLTNTDTATQPLLCDNGSVFFTDWGLGVSFSSGRYFETDAIEQSFTLHMRMQFLNTVGSRYLFRQTDNAVYAKVTDTYLDEAVGTDSTVVFLNESYFRDYTTYDIQLPIEEAALVTLEVSISDNTLSSPTLYRIEGADLVHSLVMYSGVDEHVRRHVTNKVLAEDVSTLAEKLNRFNPQSYYNLVAGAKAMFGTFSFAGVLGQQNTRLMRIKRTVGVSSTYADLLVDNTGYVTLDSKVENFSDSSSATVLGEWVANPNYDNPDGILTSDALIDRLYSQINDANYAYSAGAFAEPKLYDSINERLVSASLNGVVGLEFYDPNDDVPEKGLTLNEPIYAKTVVVVYANKTANYEMNTLLSAGYGAELYSKFSGSELDVAQLGEHGVTFYDQTTFNVTEEGLDEDVHVISIYEDAQKLVIDNTEYPITYDSIPDGIEGTELEDMARWEFIGASSAGGSFPHKGRVCAVIYYDDDKYDQREFIHNYMNTLFGIQNIPLSGSTTSEVATQSTLLTDHPGAVLALSLRQINPEYTGPCIRVRRASDNVEIDVRFNSLYEVNQSTLNVFCAGTDGFVVRLYDQSGNSNDAVQATTNDQMQIYDSSTGVYLENSVAAINNASKHMDLTSAINATAQSVFAVFNRKQLNGPVVGENSRVFYMFAGQGTYTQAAGVSDLHDYDTFNAQTLQSSHRDGTNPSDFYVNGVAITRLTGNLSNQQSTYTTIGFGQSRVFNGTIQEVIIYASDQSANRAAIESELNGYYNIYESGVLGEHLDAEAMYALDKMYSSYSGPAIRVRRDIDNVEMNVGFTNEGTLDVDALFNHCKGANGFVSVWYNQSGNGIELTQPIAGWQGKIYDEVAGVLTQGDKPSVMFNSAQFMRHYLDNNITGDMFFSGVFSKYNNTTTVDVTNSPWIRYNSDGTILTVSPISASTGLTYESGRHLVTMQVKSTGTTFSENGEVSAEYAGGTSVNLERFQMNADALYYGGSTVAGTTYWQAFALYNEDKSLDRDSIEEALNNHYNVYAVGAPPPANPVIASSTSLSNSYDGIGSASIDMPPEVSSGDLILVIASIDDSTNEKVLSAPVGYTELMYQGNSFTDIHLLVFYRISDGTEGSAIDINYNLQSANEIAAFALRITGTAPAAPSILWSSPANYSSDFLDFPSVVTTSANSLIIATSATDGSDMDPFVISGAIPPWPNEQEGYIEFIPDWFAGVSLGYLTRVVENLGDPTEEFRITGVSSDGWTGFLIQVNNS